MHAIKSVHETPPLPVSRPDKKEERSIATRSLLPIDEK